MEFNFKVSYLDQCEYTVSGHPSVNSVEEYSAPKHTLDYFKTIYNHCGDPTAFDRDITARQGGVKCGYFATRWPADLWLAYVAFKRAKFAEWVEHRAAMIEKYGSDYTSELGELVIPRPIYYDHEAHTWKTEPWYDPAQIETTAETAGAPALAGMGC